MKIRKYLQNLFKKTCPKWLNKCELAIHSISFYQLPLLKVVGIRQTNSENKLFETIDPPVINVCDSNYTHGDIVDIQLKNGREMLLSCD